MFKSNQTSNIVNHTSQNSPTINIISDGTVFKGDITAQSDIRIGGTVYGKAVSKGKLIITADGKINGNLSAHNADIAGKVEGEIRVSDKLILRQSSIIDGDIYTKTIIVEEGAQINGSCKMGLTKATLSQATDAEYEKTTHIKSAS